MTSISATSVIDAAYQQFGLETPSPTLEARRAAAMALAEGATTKSILGLIRAALGIPHREANPIDQAIVTADEDYVIGSSDQERRAVASAALADVFQRRSAVGLEASLAFTSASLGSARLHDYQEPLAAVARARLFDAQAYQPVELTPASKKSGLMAEITPVLEQAAASNSYQAASASLIKGLSGGFDFTHAVSQQLGTQLQKVAEGLSKVQEQMSVHWWVMGRTSISKAIHFVELPAIEAAVRAGLELAELTQASRWGLFPARRLLAEVLAGVDLEARHNLRNAPRGGDQEWRFGLLDEAQRVAAPAVAPVLYSNWAAAEAGDEADWVRRFERATGLDAALELSLLDVAHQTYLEKIALARSFEW